MMKYLIRREPRKVLEEKVKKELNLPKDTKVSGPRILDWMNYNNKLSGTNTQPITEQEKKVAAQIETAMYPPAASDLQMAQLKKRIENARAYVTKPSTEQRTESKQGQRDTKVMPKKDKWTYEGWSSGLEERTRPDTKKISVSDNKVKPDIARNEIADRKPIKELLEIEDWLNTIDPYWWLDDDGNPIEPKPEEHKTKLKKKTKEGITKLI